jgi:4-amino-4-deoxychorismate lyase
LNNRGLAYGDGLFETMRYVDREIPLWAHHKKRLLHSLKRLKIKLKEPLLEAELNKVIAATPKNGSRLIKLIVTRGDSDRGYKANPKARARLVWQVLDAPPCYQRPLTLGLCETRLADQPLLAGMKHLNRLEQVLARLEWDDKWDDGLMCDYHGRLIESVSANLFLLKGRRLLTPTLEKCGVAGVMRSYLVERILPKFNLIVEESSLTLEDLQQSDGLWVCNSVRGLGEVASFEAISWERSEIFADVRQTLNASLHPQWDR